MINPNCSRTIKITFNPANKGEFLGLLTFSYIEEEESQEEVLEDVYRDEAYSSAKEFEVLYSIKMQGIGGEFGIQINDCSLDAETPVMNEEFKSSTKKEEGGNVKSDSKQSPNSGSIQPQTKTNTNAGVTISANRISMDYAKITTGTSVTKTFEIQNTGDTVIETMITDFNGAEIKEGSFFGKNKRMSLKFSTTKLVIEPHSSAKIEVIVEVILHYFKSIGRR